MRISSRLAALALALLAACGPPGDPEPVQAAPAAEAAPAATRQVRVVVAQESVLKSERSASATVEPAQEAQVAAGVSGQVGAVLKRPGSSVAEGETVVQLETEALELQVNSARLSLASARVNLASAEGSSREGAGQAQAALRSAQVGLELAGRQFTEGQQLFAAGGLASTELAALEAQLAQAEAAHRQAEDAVARAGRAGGEDLELLNLQVEQAQNGLAGAENALADASIEAPFAGEVAEVMAEVGEFVAVGSPVFRLVSSEAQRARFSVPPEDAARLLEQGLVYLRYNGLDYGAQIISSEASGQSRLVALTAELYQAETRIPTGAAAQLNYPVEVGRGVLLPAAAIATVGGESLVFVVAGGLAQRQRVEVVGEAGGRAVVRGIEPGQRVVYPLPSDLRDGSSVTVVESAP